MYERIFVVMVSSAFHRRRDFHTLQGPYETWAHGPPDPVDPVPRCDGHGNRPWESMGILEA